MRQRGLKPATRLLSRQQVEIDGAEDRLDVGPPFLMVDRLGDRARGLDRGQGGTVLALASRRRDPPHPARTPRRRASRSPAPAPAPLRRPATRPRGASGTQTGHCPRCRSAHGRRSPAPRRDPVGDQVAEQRDRSGEIGPGGAKVALEDAGHPEKVEGLRDAPPVAEGLHDGQRLVVAAPRLARPQQIRLPIANEVHRARHHRLVIEFPRQRQRLAVQRPCRGVIARRPQHAEVEQRLPLHPPLARGARQPQRGLVIGPGRREVADRLEGARTGPVRPQFSSGTELLGHLQRPCEPCDGPPWRMERECVLTRGQQPARRARVAGPCEMVGDEIGAARPCAASASAARRW